MTGGLDTRRAKPPHRLLETTLDPGLVTGRDESDLHRRLRRPLADRSQQWLPDDGLVRDHQDVNALAGLFQIDHDVLDRDRGRTLGAVDQITSQPSGLDLRVGRDDHLVRLVLLEPVLQGLQWVRVDDRAAGRDPGFVQEVERPPQAPFGRRPSARLVDHEAGTRLVLRADDRDADGPVRRPPA